MTRVYWYHLVIGSPDDVGDKWGEGIFLGAKGAADYIGGIMRKKGVKRFEVTEKMITDMAGGGMRGVRRIPLEEYVTIIQRFPGKEVMKARLIKRGLDERRGCVTWGDRDGGKIGTERVVEKVWVDEVEHGLKICQLV